MFVFSPSSGDADPASVTIILEFVGWRRLYVVEFHLEKNRKRKQSKRESALKKEADQRHRSY